MFKKINLIRLAIFVFSSLYILFYLIQLVDYKLNISTYKAQKYFSRAPIVQINEDIKASNPKALTSLAYGWSSVENNTYKWSCEKNVGILFKFDKSKIEANEKLQFKIEYKYLIEPQLDLEVTLNSKNLGSFKVLSSDSIFKIPFDPSFLKNDNVINFQINNAHRTEGDSRILGIAFKNFTILSNLKKKEDFVNNSIIGRIFNVNDTSNNNVFVSGWSVCENNTYKWSDGAHPTIKFNVSNSENQNLIISYKVNMFISQDIEYQPIINGVKLKKYIAKDLKNKDFIEFDIPNHLLKNENVIDLNILNSRLPGNGDKRVLGIAVEYFTINQK